MQVVFLYQICLTQVLQEVEHLSLLIQSQELALVLLQLQMLQLLLIHNLL